MQTDTSRVHGSYFTGFTYPPCCHPTNNIIMALKGTQNTDDNQQKSCSGTHPFLTQYFLRKETSHTLRRH